MGERHPEPEPAAREPASGRRSADPFGDVLPDATRDEDGRGWGDRTDETDDWLRGEVPPHHG